VFAPRGARTLDLALSQTGFYSIHIYRCIRGTLLTN